VPGRRSFAALNTHAVPEPQIMTVNLLDLDLEALAAYCEGLGEKRFRAV
jgi:hypothetical protein